MPRLNIVDIPCLVRCCQLLDEFVKLVELLGDVDLLDENVPRFTEAGIEAVLDLKPLGHL